MPVALVWRMWRNAVPATADTRYRTASVAKPLTATIVMSLAEQGQLDLDAPVQRYCPEYPTKEWPLTTRHLLGHLGGVRHYKNPQEASSTQHYFDLRSALSTFAADPLLHEPGSKFLYSSFGYNLLGSDCRRSGRSRIHGIVANSSAATCRYDAHGCR